MIVELWWFIARPILNECKHCFKNRAQMNIAPTRKLFFLSCVIIGLALIFVPWQRSISVPAILKNQQEIPLFTSSAGILIKSHVVSGQSVKKGDLLFVFENPDLVYQVTLAQQEKDSLQQELNSKAVDQRYYREATLLEKRLQEQIATLNLKKIHEQELLVTSPIDGVISDIPDNILASHWVSKKEYLGLIRSPKTQIEAFVKETDLARITAKNKAVFYADSPLVEPLIGIISTIDSQASKYIPYPELGADFGGAIVMDIKGAQNQGATPKERHYKVIIEPNMQLAIALTKTGTAKIHSEQQSLFTKSWRKIVSIFIQESGF
jgi:putative peptide zinc metalloprotease protein